MLVQLRRMFRSPQILTRACSQRFLLLLREPGLAAFTDTGAVWQSLRHVKGSRFIQIPASPTETVSRSTQLTVFCLDCNNHTLKDVSFPNVPFKSSLSPHHPVQSPVSKATKQVWDFGTCYLYCKAASTHSTVLAKASYLQPCIRSWDQTLLSCTSKTLCNFPLNYLYYRHSVRAFSLSTHAKRILNEVPHSPQSSSFSLQQRPNHLAATRLVDTWRNCLSQENENRCRQTLAPNLKLYEVKRVGKGSSQNQGKLASILVSLCTVGGEPVFLFTLRSSTLKGRHKGDVSFAGGKSDPSDRDVVATALREAKEELGINVAAESVWGVLKPLKDVSGMMIAPVLAHLGPLEEMTLTPNPGEVEEVFTLSLSHLCKPQNRGYTNFRTGNTSYTLPVFCNGKYRVWGLTAVALDHTLKLIMPS